MRDLLIPLDTSSYLANDLAQVQRSTMAQCLRLSQIVANPEKLVFSHSTALKLLGISLPISRNHLQLREFHICVQKDSQRRKPTYVHSHVWKPADEVMPLLGTMACVSPLTAWAQMSQHLSVSQLVVLGDSMMRRNADLKWLVPNDFSRYLQSHKNFQGKRKCEHALQLMAPDTDSPPETHLRLFLNSLNLSPLSVNFPLRSDSGTIRYLDIAHVPSKTAYEYDGIFHNENSSQWQRDPERRRDFEDQGWRIFNITAEMLNEPARRENLARSIQNTVFARITADAIVTPKSAS